MLTGRWYLDIIIVLAVVIVVIMIVSWFLGWLGHPIWSNMIDYWGMSQNTFSSISSVSMPIS